MFVNKRLFNSLQTYWSENVVIVQPPQQHRFSPAKTPILIKSLKKALFGLIEIDNILKLVQFICIFLEPLVLSKNENTVRYSVYTAVKPMHCGKFCSFFF